MYPREITTTPLWIRHKLPLGPSPPPNGDKELRRQITSRNVISTDEMIEEYVRHERARLDLKWCLDQFFAWPLPNPFLGQLVVANISGFVHLAYIIDLTSVAVTITPVHKLGDLITIGYDDIYDATDSPFLENYLVNNHLLHPQQVRDYIAGQDQKHELIQSSHDDQVDMNLVESADENFEILWPSGDETWFIHCELPQRNQLLPEQQPVMPVASTIQFVEESAQEMLADGNCVVSLITQQSNEIKLSLEQSQANYNVLLKQDVSNTIDDFYYEHSDINVKTGSLTLIPTASNNSLKPHIIRSLLIGMVLTVFIFVSMIVGYFSPHSTFCTDINKPYLVSNLLFHGQNDFDWFRALAVP